MSTIFVFGAAFVVGFVIQAMMRNARQQQGVNPVQDIVRSRRQQMVMQAGGPSLLGTALAVGTGAAIGTAIGHELAEDDEEEIEDDGGDMDFDFGE
jgi:hypothetical protein